jgi:magnesium-transporting ATPase (P-type)
MLISSLILIPGIIIMFIGLYFSMKLNKLISGKFRNSVVWSIILICFFLLAYIVYFISELITSKHIIFGSYIVDLILFFGSIFVVVILIENIAVVKKLNDHSDKLVDYNKELEKKTFELEKTREELDEKNKLLNEKISDFYCLRVGYAEKSNDKKIKAENKKIKKTIDKLK